MHDRLIDLLIKKANHHPGKIYVALEPSTANWTITTYNAIHRILIDRSNIPASINAAVQELAKLLPKVELY